MQGLLFVVPVMLLAYWVLARFTQLGALQRGFALGVLVVFSLLVSAALWWPGAPVLIRELIWGLLLAYLVGILGYLREARKLARERGGEMVGVSAWGIALTAMLFAAMLFINLGLVQISERGVSDEWRQRLLPEASHALKFPGLVGREARPYEEVLRVYLSGLRHLGSRGWTLAEGWSNGPLAGTPTELTIQVAQRDRSPLTGAKVHVNLVSSINSSGDTYLALHESRPGTYTTPVNFTEPGIWGLALRIDYSGETLHLLSTAEVGRPSSR